MSTNINANVLKNFIVKTIGADKLTQNQAQKYDIDGNKYVEANKDENAYLELDEILQDSDLYEQFATMYRILYIMHKNKIKIKIKRLRIKKKRKKRLQKSKIKAKAKHNEREI